MSLCVINKHQAVKKYCGVEVGYNCIFLAQDGVSDQFNVPVTLFRWKETIAPLDVKLCGPHSESGRVGEEKRPGLSGMLKHAQSSRSPVTKPVMIVVSAMTQSVRDS
jgi:hypothetical protein